VRRLAQVEADRTRDPVELVPPGGLQAPRSRPGAEHRRGPGPLNPNMPQVGGPGGGPPPRTASSFAVALVVHDDHRVAGRVVGGEVLAFDQLARQPRVPRPRFRRLVPPSGKSAPITQCGVVQHRTRCRPRARPLALGMNNRTTQNKKRQRLSGTPRRTAGVGRRAAPALPPTARPAAPRPGEVPVPCANLPGAAKILGAPNNAVCCQDPGVPTAPVAARSSGCCQTARVLPNESSVLPESSLPPSRAAAGVPFGDPLPAPRGIHAELRVPPADPAVSYPGRRDDRAGGPAGRGRALPARPTVAHPRTACPAPGQLAGPASRTVCIPRRPPGRLRGAPPAPPPSSLVPRSSPPSLQRLPRPPPAPRSCRVVRSDRRGAGDVAGGKF